MNNVFLMGVLKEKTISEAKNGMAVLRGVVRVNGRPNQDGVRREDDIPFVMFGDNAVKVSLERGDGELVSMSGKIRSNSYEHNGERRNSVEIHIHSLQAVM